ncbi:MAG: TerB family tellurite resistance protein, partial [Hyphomicrobiales bacterium]|nr:TerB family tellurite resistance protein [Hyphomicrobiales bacterium]
MLGKIRSWLAGAQQEPSGARSEQDLHLASLALLVFAAQLDGHFDRAERQKINECAQNRFGLSPEMAQDIINEAC